MPIGKNAIKRVSNNGYSNVKTEAPDMENSVVEKATKPTEKNTAKKAPSTKSTAKKSAVTTEKTASKPASAKKAAPKAAPAKKAAPKKSMEREPELRPVRTLEKITEKNEAVDAGYVNFGRELPVHLL